MTPTTTPAAPRWATARTPERLTYGGAVADLAALLGTPLMPWQRQVVDVALEVLEDGSWAYRTIVVTVPRQSGKTTLIGPLAIHRCLINSDSKTWLTAQSRGDARDTWRDIATRIKRVKALKSMVKVRESNGTEAINFDNGSSFRPFSTHADALHGTTNHLVAVDEIWAFTGVKGEELEQAILPTFTTTGGQMLLTSTAGTADSHWFGHYQKIGRAAVEADTRDTIAYFEWSIGDNVEPTDLAGVLAAHPGNGYTLRLDALKAAAASMPPGQFARAYGNRGTATSERIIGDTDWTQTTRVVTVKPEPGTVTLAYDISPDSADGAIAACWHVDGKPHVQIVDARDGTAWIVGRLTELIGTYQPRNPIMYDKAGPGVYVAQALDRAGVSVEGTDARSYAAACGAFLAATINHGFTHHPDRRLDHAVEGAARRPLGDSWAWARLKSASSIAALVAATLAYAGHNSAPRELIIPRPQIW